LELQNKKKFFSPKSITNFLKNPLNFNPQQNNRMDNGDGGQSSSVTAANEDYYKYKAAMVKASSDPVFYDSGYLKESIFGTRDGDLCFTEKKTRVANNGKKMVFSCLNKIIKKTPGKQTPQEVQNEYYFAGVNRTPYPSLANGQLYPQNRELSLARAGTVYITNTGKKDIPVFAQVEWRFPKDHPDHQIKDRFLAEVCPYEPPQLSAGMDATATKAALSKSENPFKSDVTKAIDKGAITSDLFNAVVRYSESSKERIIGTALESAKPGEKFLLLLSSSNGN
jgi:hypothetical protein